MQGENPMEGAGWGSSGNRDREGFSERDPALGRRRKGRGDSQLPRGALLIAVVGLIAGVVGSVATSGSARFDLTVEEGLARVGFAIAILAGLWISLGARDRAPGARIIGFVVILVALLATIATS